MDKNDMSTVQGSGAWYCETYCINTFRRQCCHQII